MAYQAQEWTVNGLSVELKLDRRTVAKRLEKVPPCRTEGIAKYYRLVDAAPALLVPELRGSRVSADGKVIDFNDERARLTKEQADKIEMENERLRKELGSVAAMRRLIERLVGGANARLGALPAKLAPVIRPDDPVTARRHMELAIEEVRAELRRLEVEEPDEEAA